MKYQCTICPNTSNYTTFKVKEMQLGLREEFLYVLCNDCQCIQIADIPLHLEKYYPGKDYYSFSSIALRNKLYSIYFDIVAAASFSKKGLFFKMVDAYGLYDYSLLAIGRLAPPKDWKILDVGSGNGQLLYQLTKLGYKDVHGIDLFIPTTNYPVDVRKIKIAELPSGEMYDLIMFHHSFEHIEHPIQTLAHAKAHLQEGGVLLIRAPLVASAFEKYRQNWFQLDAPRHLHLQSLKGIEIMIGQGGLELIDIYCDSRDEQFYISENYIHDIAMSESKQSPVKSLASVLFSKARKKFRLEAKSWNKQMKGDTVAYYVKKGI